LLAWASGRPRYLLFSAAVRENAAFRDRMPALGAEIAAKWQSDKTAVELIEEQRR
jgi:hypothetical protein